MDSKMEKFGILFGVKKSEIKKTCILMPLVSKVFLKGFGVNKLKNGKLYSVGTGEEFSLIRTGMQAGLLGDAVLYLNETPCRNLILFGSCGLLNDNNLGIGNLVAAIKAYSYESLSDMLLHKKAKVYYPHKILLNKLLKNKSIKKVSCATISSLKLEEQNLDLFIKKGIDVVDMECSAFFAAAKFSGLKAITLFYVSDIVKKFPFYQAQEEPQKSVISEAVRKSSRIICEFIRENLSD